MSAILCLGSGVRALEQATPVFRYTLFTEPHSLDPQKTGMTSSSYLFANIYRGLMFIDGEDRLRPEMAESCVRQRSKASMKIICQLRPKLLWSDGSPLKAVDFVRAFQTLINPKNNYSEAELLLSVKNASEIFKGEKNPETLGVRALDDRRLEIELVKPDEEFEWKLANTALSPRPPSVPNREEASKLLVNGPYQVVEWKIGKKIILKNNPNYFKKQSRPTLEVYFIADDALALRMFEGHQLDFNRRILEESVKVFKNHPGFKRVGLARFDYIGFGPSFKAQLDLRKAMLKGVEYEYFAQLFESKTTAGCPSIDKKYFSSYFCLTKDLDKAKQLMAEVPKEVSGKKYIFGFSLLGGAHVEKGVQWFQNQWKKNLGLKIELRSQEQGLYIQQLKQAPPDLFRKGVTIDRPTCLAGLELFKSDHPENYIRLQSKEYDHILEQLNQKQSEKRRKELCSKAFKILVDEAVMVPLGEMYFNVMSSPQFSGWTVNSLNVLDLTNLRYVQQ